MDTTIQISKELRKELQNRKFSSRESYEAVIWDLLEDTLELSEETKRDLAEARKEFKEGKTISHKQVLKELGL